MNCKNEEKAAQMESLLDVMAQHSSMLAAEANTPERGNPSHDEILIDFLIDNPCLWDKSDHDFRNRVKKEYKWKEVAQRINMAAHEAIRRYKTLCERFRREMIKQSSIPNFTSTWCLFDKFAALKDAQSSDERKLRIKEEPALENEVIDYAALAAAATVATSSSIQTPKAQKRKRKSQSSTSISDFNGTMAMTNGNGALEIDHNGIDLKIPHIDRIFHNQSIDEDQDTNESMHVEPTFIGGSTDLSADTVAAFCSFLEANLKQMTTDRSDDLIEEISMLLFRRKREYKQKDRSHEEKTTNSAFAAQPPQSSPSSQTPSSQPINEFTT